MDFTAKWQVTRSTLARGQTPCSCQTSECRRQRLCCCMENWDLSYGAVTPRSEDRSVDASAAEAILSSSELVTRLRSRLAINPRLHSTGLLSVVASSV